MLAGLGAVYLIIGAVIGWSLTLEAADDAALDEEPFGIWQAVWTFLKCFIGWGFVLTRIFGSYIFEKLRPEPESDDDWDVSTRMPQG